MIALCVMPHPDDCEILCAGTLLRLAEQGVKIHVATMTAGDKGSMSLPPEKISAIRRVEAANAAKHLGASSYTCLEFEDLSIVFDNPTRQKIAGLLRKIKPDIIFTTPPVDYMADHEITSSLVRDACFNASVPNYHTGTDDAPTQKIPYLYYSDPIGGEDLFGDKTVTSVLVNITTVMDRKVEALSCHASQREWLREQHGIDEYVDAMKRWAAVRGAELGVTFAEGFRQHLGHPHPTECLLRKLLW